MPASSGRSPRDTSSKSATSARPEGIFPATSKRIPPSMVLAPPRRTPTGDGSTPTVPPTGAPAISRRSRCCETSRARRYQAGQASVSRRFGGTLGFNVSYWYSRTFDYLSAMNLSGAAAKPLAGENDLAQNPFDLDAEYGPSLFDARHRFVASASWKPTIADRAPAAVRAIFGGWQLNGIATHNSGTPFTVSDSANVALQANSPPISGFPASRPDLVGDPNAGPRTVDEWLSRSAFRAPEPSDPGRAVRQRRPQHRARAVVHQCRHVARPRFSVAR